MRKGHLSGEVLGVRYLLTTDLRALDLCRPLESDNTLSQEQQRYLSPLQVQVNQYHISFIIVYKAKGSPF